MMIEATQNQHAEANLKTICFFYAIRCCCLFAQISTFLISSLWGGMDNLYTLQKAYICAKCLEDLRDVSEMHMKEYALTCQYHSASSIRKVYTDFYLQDIIKYLEEKRYVISTETQKYTYIKPLGHKKLEAYKNVYCIKKEHDMT
jgi:hypothetical protein